MIGRVVKALARRGTTRKGVVTTIHPADEMYAFISDIDPGSPVEHYLVSGESMFTALVDALAAAGRVLDPEGTFLEFACGHGRFTRHLVTHVDRERVTVSDIHRGAVDFVTETFGVDGFVSVADPRRLRHRDRYQTIFVASLFSHLPHHRWGPWVDALLALLAPGGVLVMSTHGPSIRDELESHDHLVEVEPGFWYGPANETGGRLSADEYGTTYVTEEWVRASIAGTVLARTDRSLWTVQDLYVVTAPS